MQDWKFEQLKRHRIHYLYHLTHIDNLPSVLQHGLLSWQEIHDRKLEYKDISLESVQARRDSKRVKVAAARKRCVHEMVPLFLRPRTPMLYKRKEQANDLCFILVNSTFVARDDVECVVCNGNVAADATRTTYTFGPGGKYLDELPWAILNRERWDDHPDGSRMRAAEFLIWPRIPASAFWKLQVKTTAAQERVQKHLEATKSRLACEVAAGKFF